jgi:hypothetical protein
MLKSTFCVPIPSYAAHRNLNPCSLKLTSKFEAAPMKTQLCLRIVPEKKSAKVLRRLLHRLPNLCVQYGTSE